MHALALWFSSNAPPELEEIRVIFPVRGHSFLPADRVFGRLEKKLKKQEVILNMDDYIKIYQEVGTVQVLGQDWTITDYKQLHSKLKKLVGIKEMKRILFKKNKQGMVQVKMEQFYRNDDLSKSYESITKKRLF